MGSLSFCVNPIKARKSKGGAASSEGITTLADESIGVLQ
jgi:hypothetical protein